MSVTISAAKTTYSRNVAGNAILRNTAFTPPAALYLALFSADPTDAGSLTNEISGNAYARQPITFSAPSTVSGGQQFPNTSAVNFPTATANWLTVTHFAIMDAATGGNMWYKGAWTSPINITNGTQFQAASGTILITEY